MMVGLIFSSCNEQVIEQFLGESLEGKYLVMDYLYNIHISEGSWSGVVYLEKPDLALSVREREDLVRPIGFIVMMKDE